MLEFKKNKTGGTLMNKQLNTKKKLAFVIVVLALTVITILVAVAPIMADASVPQTVTQVNVGTT
jgi:hypothetical protein